MRRKIKPVTNIEDRAFPQLGWVNTLEGRGPLHIADRRGTQDGLSVSVTRCGRTIRFYHYLGDGIVKTKPGSIGELLSTFRLCARCGSADEFSAALELWRAGYAKQIEEYRERRAQEEAESQARWAVQEARAERLRAALPFPPATDRHHSLAFQFEGFKYRIEELGPIDSEAN